MVGHSANVAAAALTWAWRWLPLADVAPGPLPPRLRTPLLMALLGLIVLAIGLGALVIVGARMVRRRARDGVGPSVAVPLRLSGSQLPPEGLREADSGRPEEP